MSQNGKSCDIESHLQQGVGGKRERGDHNRPGYWVMIRPSAPVVSDLPVGDWDMGRGPGEIQDELVFLTEEVGEALLVKKGKVVLRECFN